jgi:hypothetical protein
VPLDFAIRVLSGANRTRPGCLEDGDFAFVIDKVAWICGGCVQT